MDVKHLYLGRLCCTEKMTSDFYRDNATRLRHRLGIYWLNTDITILHKEIWLLHQNITFRSLNYTQF
jgi:hypothetical protein